jgi:hypothetical protein
VRSFSATKEIKMKRLFTPLFFAFLGWAACGATMGIGMSVMTIDKALIVHAVAAPIYFGLLSLVYFKRLRYTGPLKTALLFLGFVVFMDFFLVALIIYRSLDMFRSPLGTWIPFVLIFGATWVTGKLVVRGGTQSKS